jgi:hypothetical protein
MTLQTATNGRAIERAPQCPTCASMSVTTPKGATADGYCRCLSCGEIWNIARCDSHGRAPMSQSTRPGPWWTKR